jgi:hypothetical protein
VSHIKAFLRFIFYMFPWLKLVLRFFFNFCAISPHINTETNFFGSTLSKFENFLLCERILINVTIYQNETSS